MSEEAQPVEKPAMAHVVTQLKYPLPDPDVSFERHWEILRAYVVASKEGKEPVSYKDFGKLTVSPARISGNNKFFEHIGLISKVEGTKGKYLPTAEAIAIHKDLAWKKETNVKARVAKLVTRSWFGQSARALLTIKEKVAESELLEQLGYDSGADPKKHTPSLRVLIEYLKFSELVKPQDGSLVLGEVPTTETERETREETMEEVKREQAKQEQPQQPFFTSKIPFVLGVFVSPEMTEEQIRKAVRILLNEISRTGNKHE